MPIYKMNGGTYDIPDSLVNDFEKQNPDATVSYSVGEDEYEIPVREREAFVKDFPHAVRGGSIGAAAQQPYNGDFTMPEGQLVKPSGEAAGTMAGEAAGTTAGGGVTNTTNGTSSTAAPKKREAGKLQSIVKTEERDGKKLRYYEENGRRIYHPDDVTAWQAGQGEGESLDTSTEPLPMGVTRWQWEHAYTEEQRAEMRSRMKAQAQMHGAATGVASTENIGDMQVARSAGEWEGAVSRRSQVEGQSAWRASGGRERQEARERQLAEQQAAVDALPDAMTSLRELEQRGVDAGMSVQYNPETGRMERTASMTGVEVTDEAGNRVIVDEEGHQFRDEAEKSAYDYQKQQENIRRSQYGRALDAQEAYRSSHSAPASEPREEDYASASDYAQAKAWWEEMTESMSLPEHLKDESREAYLLRVEGYMDRMRQYYERRMDEENQPPIENIAGSYLEAMYGFNPDGETSGTSARREYSRWAEGMRTQFPELFDTKTNEAMEILFNPVLRLGRSAAELIANGAETLGGSNKMSDTLRSMADASMEREQKRIVTNRIADLWNKHGGILSATVMGGAGMPMIILTGAGDQAYQARANGASALGASAAGVSNAIIWTMASKLIGTPLTNSIFNRIGKLQSTRALEYINNVLGGANKNAAAVAQMKRAMADFIEQSERTMQMSLTKTTKAHLMSIASGTFHSTLDMATASALCQFICLYDGEKVMKTDEKGNIVEAESLSEKLSEAGRNALQGLKEGAVDGALFGLFFGAFGHGMQMWHDRKALKGVVAFTPDEVQKTNGEAYSSETDMLLGMSDSYGAVIIMGKSAAEGNMKCMLSNGTYVDIPASDFSLVKVMKKSTFEAHLNAAVDEYYNGELDTMPETASEYAKAKVRYANALQKMQAVNDWSEEERAAIRGNYRDLGQLLSEGKIDERHAAVIEEYQQAAKAYDEVLNGARRGVMESTAQQRRELEGLAYVGEGGERPDKTVEVIIRKGGDDREPHRGYVLSGDWMSEDGDVMVYDTTTGTRRMMKAGDIEAERVVSIDAQMQALRQNAMRVEAAKIDGDVSDYLREGAGDFPVRIDGEIRYVQYAGMDEAGNVVLRFPSGEQMAEPREMVQAQYESAVKYEARTFDVDERGRITGVLAFGEADAEAAMASQRTEQGEEAGSEAGRSEAGGDELSAPASSSMALPAGEAAGTAAAMPMVEVDGKMKPDYSQADPRRTRDYIYDERGLSEDEADRLVGNNIEAAKKAVEELDGQKPEMGTDVDEYQEAKAAWQEARDAAERNVAYWERVKQEQLNAKAAAAKAAFAEAVEEELERHAGIFRKGYSNKKETVAKTEPQQPTNAVSTGTSLSAGEVNGITPAEPNGEPTVSDDKGREIFGDMQGIAEKISSAESETDVNPTEAQKVAGNYKKGHVRIDGYDVSIEQPKGSIRRGTDASGRQWEQEMHHTYGYIRGTKGVDGDHIDVFLSDNPTEGNVYVIDQRNADGSFDEHKVMYGFRSEEEARAAYLSNYEEGWQGLGAITEVSKEEFRKWIDSSHRKTKPFVEYKSVKRLQENVRENLAENGENATFAQKIDPLYERFEREQDTVDTEGGLVRNEVSSLILSNHWQGTLHALGRHIGRRIEIISRERIKATKGERWEEYANRAQGWVEGNTIYLNEDFVRDDEALRGFVVGHEVTHVLKKEMASTPEVWEAFVETVRTAMGDTFERECDAIRERYKKSLKEMGFNELSDDQVAEEVCCDWAGHHMLTDADAIRKVIEKAEAAGGDSKTLISKMLAWIEDALKSIRARLSRGENVTAQYESYLRAKEIWQGMYDVVAKKRMEGKKNDTTFSFAKDRDEFDETRDRAIREKGIVTPNLAEKEVTVVDVPKHDFTGTGEDAIRSARAWAKENIVGIHTATDGDGKQFEYEISNNSVEKYLSSASTKKSDSLGAHLAVLKELPNVITNSIEAEVHPDYTKGDTGERSSNNRVNEDALIHRFYGAVSLDGHLHRVKTTIREYADANRSNKAHSYEVTKIELIEAPSDGGDTSIEPVAMTSTNSISGANLLQDVEKSYERGKKLLKESEKSSNSTRFSLTDEIIAARDREYAEAVEAGNTEKVDAMLREEAARKGYSPDSDYQGKSAFNGAAPARNVYFRTREERVKAFEDANFEGDASLGDFMEAGIDLGNLDWLVHDGIAYRTASDAGKESIKNLRSVVDGKKKTIKMYRSVPADIKEGEFRNGDWVTPSKKYAEENAEIHGWADYRIIEQEVPVDDVWWDNNDINEWGYDNGKGEVYKNTENNRKMLEPTYDDAGNLIPLSQRFNENIHDVRFSLADKERTLMGVHNISEEKLRKAIKQGGLANPSMAVIDTKQGIHTDFGDINLIPKSSLIDTKKGRNAGTYAGDIWSPTYPSVSKFLTKQGEEHRMRIAKEVADGDNEMERHIASTIFDYIEGNVDRLHFLFLKQKGLNPQVRGERIKHSHEEYEAVRELLGDDFVNAREFTDEQGKALLNLMTSAYEEKVRQNAEKISDPEKRQAATDALIKTNREKFVDENGKLYFSYVNSYLYDVWRDEGKRQNPKPDWYGTDVDAQYRVAQEGLGEEYAAWKESLFDEGDVEERLFDGYTPSGNRRYVANTIENASKLMNKRSITNANDEGGLGATRSALLQRFTTLKDIREHKDMLRKDDEVKEAYDAMSNELFDIIKQLSDMQKISDNQFSNIDYAEARLQEAITHRDPIGYLNREFGYSIDKNSDYASQLMNFIDDVKNLPSKYFETKFKRPVALDEFAVAVVPENTSADVVKALQDAGLEVHTYAGDENGEHRTAAVLNAVRGRDDIMFSLAGERENNDESALRIGEKVVPLQAEDIEYVRRQKESLPKTAPWRSDFPRSVILTAKVQSRYPALYAAAKRGDNEAAYNLVQAISSSKGTAEKIARLVTQYPNAIVAYPHAEEDTGRNKIPTFWAAKLEDAGLRATDDIRIVNRPRHTGSDDIGRLIRRARFEGEVEKGGKYILIDDQISSGATLRDMKDYIESHGGEVVQLVGMTANMGGHQVAPSEAHANRLRELGVTDKQLQDYGIAESIEHLTDGEAAKLIRLVNGGRAGRPEERPEGIYGLGKGEVRRGEGTQAGRATAEQKAQLKEKGITDEEPGNAVGQEVSTELSGTTKEGVSAEGGDALGVYYRKGLRGPRYEESLRASKEAGYTKKQHDAWWVRNQHNMYDAGLEAVRKLGIGSRVTFISEAEELGKFSAEQRRAKAWYDAKTGRIYVNVSNHANAGDIVKSVLHEGVGHFGLRKMFGENFHTFLDNAYREAEKPIRDAIDTIASKGKFSVQDATEEYLSRLAEDVNYEQPDNQTWFHKVKDMFLRMLQEVGLPGFGGFGNATYGTRLSDNELRYILWRSYQNMANPSRYKNVFRTAEDTVMQSRLGVGRYEREAKRIFGLGGVDLSRYAAEDFVGEENGTVHFRDVETPTAGETEEAYFDGTPRFSLVDREKADELEREPKVKVYRAMQLHDGKLYPPMAGKINGEWQSPIELGVWEQADEHPELARKDGKFKLDKGNGKSIWAAYNPYLHTSRSLLNDQFSSAWSRPELVTVEVEVPESELTSGYRAEKAKDAVGEVEWKSGPVSGQLAKQGNPRRVILSRYDKPVRIVPAAEVAVRIAEMLDGTGIEIPFNTITPELRDALVSQGVKIGKPQKGNAGNAAKETYQAWKAGGEVRFSFAGERGADEADHAEGVLARTDALSVAKQMEADGKVAPDIKRATGWERGKDGKWRYEIQDDIEAANVGIEAILGKARKEVQELDDKADRLIQKANILDTSIPKRLTDRYSEEDKAKYMKMLQERDRLLDEWYKTRRALTEKQSEMHDGIDTTLGEILGDGYGLFKYYPDMKSMPVTLTESLDANGEYEDGKLRLRIKDGMASTLLHEVQHAIQSREGFARGGNLRSVIDDMDVRGVFIDELRRDMVKIEDMLQVVRDAKDSDEAIARYAEANSISEERARAYLNAEEARLLLKREHYQHLFSMLSNDNMSREKAYEYYRRIAGEVEARNVQARASMTSAERRRSLGEETEDIIRGEQIVTHGTGGSEEIEVSDGHNNAVDSEQFRKSETSISGANLLQDVEKSYERGKKLLDESARLQRIEAREAEDGTRFSLAYHGSAADFDRFDHSHMGEGEGAQAYGWGTYVTEVKGIGKMYAKEASINKGTDTDEPFRTTYRGKRIPRDVSGREPHFPRMAQAVADAVESGRAETFDEARRSLERAQLMAAIRMDEAGHKEAFERHMQNYRALEALREEDFELAHPRRVLYEVEIPDDLVETRRIMKQESGLWNKYLQWFREGKLDGKNAGTMLLGRPSELLRACGLGSDDAIFIKPKVLKEHIKKHGLTISELRGLPMALNEPLLVYEWGTKAKSLIVVTELTAADGRKITAALKMERNGRMVEVNEVASIHGKEAWRFLDEMVNAKHGGLKDALRYVGNKKKVLDWLGIAPPRGAASLTDQELSVAKVVENFENPKLPEKKIGEYLDWTQRMSKQGDILDAVDNTLLEQGWHRQEVDSRIRFTKGSGQIILTPDQTGQDLYAEIEDGLAKLNALDAAKHTSELLHDAGLTGIKYPADYTRGGRDDGAKNYVIFDEDDVQITNKTRFSFGGGGSTPSRRMGVNEEARDVKEVAAEVMSAGNMLWDDVERNGSVLKGVKSETGYGDGEKKRLFGLFRSAEKGGKSVDEVAHAVVELCDAYRIPCDGTYEAKEAVLSILGEVEKMSDIRNYARNRRLDEADEQTRYEMEMEQAERDKHYMDEYGMTEEEYEDYVQRSMQELFTGSEEDAKEIQQLRSDKERLEARLAEEKAKNLSNPLVSFLNEQISNFKDEIEHLRQESAEKVGDKQKTINSLRSRLRALKKSRTEPIRQRLERLASVRERFKDEVSGQFGNSIELIRKQRILERMERLEAELNNPDRLLSDRVLETEMKNLELASIKEDLVYFIEKQIDAAWMPYMSKAELNSLLREVKNANTAALLEEAREKVRDIAANGSVRHLQAKVGKLLRLQRQGVNGRNMNVAKNVDERTRKIFDNLFRSTEEMRVTGMEDDLDAMRKQERGLRDELDYLERQKTGTDAESLSDIEAEIAEKRAAQEALREQMREQKRKIDEARHAGELRGFADADAALESIQERLEKSVRGEGKWTDRDTDELVELQVKQLMRDANKYAAEADDLAKKMARTGEEMHDMYETAKAEGSLGTDSYRQARERKQTEQHTYRQLSASAKQAQAEKLAEVERKLSELIEGGRNSLRYEIQKDIDRRQDILRNAYADIKGKHYDIDHGEPIQDQDRISSWLTYPLYSFEYMCQKVARNSRGTESWLYDYFIRGKNGVMAARDEKLRGMRQQERLMNGKVTELFGIKDGSLGIGAWVKLAEQSEDIERETGIHLLANDGTDIKWEASKGQAMYVYMLWKMADGRVKLENQGFRETSIEQVKDFLGDKYVELADWVQDEFLTATREKYNEKYLQMYHTSMNKIAHYVPIKINKDAIAEKSDNENKSGSAEKQNLDRKAGSLINRTHNVSSIDLSKSAFDVISEHVEDMEDWYAYVQVRRDLDTLLSGRHFRNQLNVNSPGDYKRFRVAASIATESEDIAPATEMDRLVSNMTKNVVGVNIAFRLNTALKQFLSAPAYLAYSTNPKFLALLAKNAGKSVAWNNMKWCYDNLESFRERVDVGDLGENRLSENEQIAKRSSATRDKFFATVDAYSKGVQKANSFGMLPNRLVDAMTCSMGIKAIYDYEMTKAERYAKDAGLEGDARASYMEQAKQKALREADIFYNATQQSSHPAFLSEMQKSRNVIARAFSAYQNSDVAYTRMIVNGLRDLRKDIHFRESMERYTRKFRLAGMSKEAAKQEARTLMVKNYWDDLSRIGVPILLRALWVAGGKGLLGFFTSGDDENEEQTTEQKVAGYVENMLMPWQGMPGVNMAMDFAEASKNGWDFDANPILGLNELAALATDVIRAQQKYGLISPELAGRIALRLSRFSGVDIQTLSNIVLGVEGLVNDGHDYQDYMVDVMYMLNTPKSGRREVARVLAQDAGSMEEYAERVLLADGYLKRHPELSKWMPWMRELDANGTVPDDEAKQLTDEWLQLQRRRGGEPAGKAAGTSAGTAAEESADEATERAQQLKDMQSDSDKYRKAALKQMMKELEPYHKEYQKLLPKSSDRDYDAKKAEAEAYKSKHPEVMQYNSLNTIKKLIDRWTRKTKEGEMSPENAADSIKNALKEVKM